MDIVSENSVNTTPDVSGPAMSDTVFRRLLRRLGPGSIAVIDLPDFDEWTADQLLARGIAAVVNTSESVTGRSPVAGVSFLLENGVQVLDRVGEELMDELQQGEILSISGDSASLRGGVQVKGVRMTTELAEGRLLLAQKYLGQELANLATAVADRTSGEWAYFFQSLRNPDVERRIRGKIAIVIRPSKEAVSELRSLRRLLHRAVILASEKGREAAARVGITPQFLVGRSENLTEQDLACGSIIVLVTDPGVEPEALERCRRLGIEAHVLEWPGPADEAALALAADSGARLVLQVGAAEGIPELVRRGDGAIGAAILTRLRLGDRVMDAATHRRLKPPLEVPLWVYAGLAVIGVGLVWLIVRALLNRG
jgi:uncharacterized membrane-anchored protein